MNRFDNDLRDTVIDLVRDAIHQATRFRARVCAHCGSQACRTHCVYCGADCTHPEPGHRDTCPAVTGVYPVDEPDMACARCAAPLDLVYHLVHIADDIAECVCAGCAAAAELDS